jgi:hypothetical protein
MGKDERKKVVFSQRFRPKVFDMYFPKKVFNGVFELSLLRNAQRRWEKTKGKTKSQFFRPKVFDMFFPQLFFFNGVFELTLLRNAQKSHISHKKSIYLPHLSSARYTSLSIFFFFGAPRHSASNIKHQTPNTKHQAAVCMAGIARMWYIKAVAIHPQGT